MQWLEIKNRIRSEDKSCLSEWTTDIFSLIHWQLACYRRCSLEEVWYGHTWLVLDFTCAACSGTASGLHDTYTVSLRNQMCCHQYFRNWALPQSGRGVFCGLVISPFVMTNTQYQTHRQQIITVIGFLLVSWEITHRWMISERGKLQFLNIPLTYNSMCIQS